MVEARGLKNSHFIGSTNPFCELKFDDREVVRTNVQNSTMDPQWNEALELMVYEPTTQSLQVRIKDHGFRSDKDLGQVKVALNTIQPDKVGFQKKKKKRSPSFYFISCFSSFTSQ